MSQVILARFYVLRMTYLTKLNHISTAPRKKQISICPCSQHPKVDTTQKPLIRQLDKQNVVYTHWGILFSLEKEVKGNSDSCCDVDETWGHCAEWNQSHKRTRAVWRSWGTSGQPTSWRQCRTEGIRGHSEGKAGSDYLTGTEFPNGMVKNFWIWTVVRATRLWICLMSLNSHFKMAKMTNLINILPWLKQNSDEINYCTRMTSWGTSSLPVLFWYQKQRVDFHFILTISAADEPTHT